MWRITQSEWSFSNTAEAATGILLLAVFAIMVIL
jgi:hypothetical protein